MDYAQISDVNMTYRVMKGVVLNIKHKEEEDYHSIMYMMDNSTLSLNLQSFAKINLEIVGFWMTS